MFNYIIYHAAGNTDRINECRYSLLQYLSIYNLKPPADIGVIIYTDAPATFEVFESFFNQFELKEASALPTRLELMKDILASKQGSFLFMDTDSYFIEPVDSIFKTLQQANFLFYKLQASIENLHLSQFQTIRDFLSRNNVEVEGEKISYPAVEKFYSTQILGMNNSSMPLLLKMCTLYAQLAGPTSAVASEEFACSYYAKNASVQTAENTITNYRHFPQFKNLLRLFFKKNEEESIPNLVKLAHHINAQTILQEKKQYDSQPFVKKLLSALSGKAWSVRQYQNKF